MINRGLLFTVLLCGALIGCTKKNIDSHLTNEVGTITAILEITPYPPVPMQDTLLQFTLSDSSLPVDGASIELVMTMPGCTMAPSFLTTTAIGDGKYQVNTVLTMAGAWQIDGVLTYLDKQEKLKFFFVTK